jgi:hypothetical protein
MSQDNVSTRNAARIVGMANLLGAPTPYFRIIMRRAQGPPATADDGKAKAGILDLC